MHYFYLYDNPEYRCSHLSHMPTACGPQEALNQPYNFRKARLNPLRRLWQAPGEAFERWQLLLKMWNNSAVQSPPTCPWAEACQHCQVSRWKGTQLNCCFLLDLIFHLNSGIVGHWSSVGSHLLCLLQLWQLVQLQYTSFAQNALYWGKTIDRQTY